MIRNIIFDWSGTLVDDLPAVLGATNHVLRKAGLAEMTLERFRAEFSLPFKKFYDRFTPHVPMAQLEEWFHAHFKEMRDTVEEIPHAATFLRACRERAVRTFVLSTMHPEHFAVQLARTSYGNCFERTYLGVLDKEARIREVLDDNQLRPAETLFIGDMQHDIDAARHGRIYSCAVLTGYTGIEQLRASQPDLIVEHLAELHRLLDQQQWEFSPGHTANSTIRSRTCSNQRDM